MMYERMTAAGPARGAQSLTGGVKYGQPVKEWEAGNHVGEPKAVIPPLSGRYRYHLLQEHGRCGRQRLAEIC